MRKWKKAGYKSAEILVLVISRKRIQPVLISKATNAFVSPSIGTFYKRNKLAGLYLNYGYSEYSNISPSVIRSYGGGVFLRQYQPVINKLYILFDERAGYNYQFGKSNTNTFNGFNLNASVQAGMAYDIAKKMQLELLISNLLYANYTHTNRSENYNIGTSLEGNSFTGITLGFRFYLK